MQAYNYRPGDDGSDPFLVIIFTIVCMVAVIVIAGVLASVFL